MNVALDQSLQYTACVSRWASTSDRLTIGHLGYDINLVPACYSWWSMVQRFVVEAHVTSRLHC